MRRVQLDVRDPDGRDAFLALAAGADVVVESFRPGVVDRLGIGYEAVRAVNDGVVYCSTSGFGQDGPRAGWAGHDLNYLAVCGYLATSQPAGRRRALPSPAPPSPTPPAAACTPPWRSARPWPVGPAPARAPTSTCRWPTGSCGSCRWPPTSTWPPGPSPARPRRAHRPLRLLRHLSRRRRQVAGGGGHRGQVLRQPVPAPSTASSGSSTSTTTTPRTTCAVTSPPPSPGADRDEWVDGALGGRHLRGPGAGRGRDRAPTPSTRGGARWSRPSTPGAAPSGRWARSWPA